MKRWIFNCTNSSTADFAVTSTWLSSHKKYIHWDIPGPGASSLNALANAFDAIQQWINELVKRGHG